MSGERQWLQPGSFRPPIDYHPDVSEETRSSFPGSVDSVVAYFADRFGLFVPSTEVYVDSDDGGASCGLFTRPTILLSESCVVAFAHEYVHASSVIWALGAEVDHGGSRGTLGDPVPRHTGCPAIRGSHARERYSGRVLHASSAQNARSERADLVRIRPCPAGRRLLVELTGRAGCSTTLHRRVRLNGGKTPSRGSSGLALRPSMSPSRSTGRRSPHRVTCNKLPAERAPWRPGSRCADRLPDALWPGSYRCTWLGRGRVPARGWTPCGRGDHHA